MSVPFAATVCRLEGLVLNKDVEMSKRQTTQHISKQQLEPGEVQVQKPESHIKKERRAGL